METDTLFHYNFFDLKEFACPCCGVNKIDPTLVYHLDELRACLRMPIIVTSGYRCHAHNASIGGVVDSYHIMGKAVDFRFDKAITPRIRYNVLREIMCNNFFKGIGIYNGFFHLDCRCSNTCWIDSND